MGMSTHIVGFIEKDETFNKMLGIYELCNEAGVSIPDEVNKFFEWDNPIGKPGLQVDIDTIVETYSGEYESGYQIDVRKIPKNITHIRFYNSY